ncbi:hypothetical protein PaecuDRAFT_3734 [Paenibacillus curdlanolyticus YK9]|uniref:Uncharacterized protein n=1 Tax=Paenibacillus curdlanolyticus YK9 TaxID=717606 RepID=E0ICX0_9BACL|nr:hypothetical protein [Paenibacillus curdlanolyticus]EFM09685.1 hypothetical protein PaecuDRAFT_3734 [Paenibacillus curdlanolyticus YK9]
MTGTLYKPLFRQHKFVGKVTIDGYDFTKTDVMMDIYITQRNKGYSMGSLVYFLPTNRNQITQQGMIWFDDDFKHINIWAASDWGRKVVNDSLYVVNKPDYEQAMASLREVTDRFDLTIIPATK